MTTDRVVSLELDAALDRLADATRGRYTLVNGVLPRLQREVMDDRRFGPSDRLLIVRQIVAAIETGTTWPARVTAAFTVLDAARAGSLAVH